VFPVPAAKILVHAASPMRSTSRSVVLPRSLGWTTETATIRQQCFPETRPSQSLESVRTDSLAESAGQSGACFGACSYEIRLFLCSIMQSNVMEHLLYIKGICWSAKMCKTLHMPKTRLKIPDRKVVGFDPLRHQLNQLVAKPGIFGCLFLCPNYDQTLLNF